MFTEDLTEFFDTEDFAVVATFSGFTKNVIFTDESENRNVFDTAIEHESAYFTAQADTEINNVAQDDEVTIEGVTYIIKRIEKDGIGVKNFYLKTKQS